MDKNWLQIIGIIFETTSFCLGKISRCPDSLDFVHQQKINRRTILVLPIYFRAYLQVHSSLENDMFGWSISSVYVCLVCLEILFPLKKEVRSSKYLHYLCTLDTLVRQAQFSRTNPSDTSTPTCCRCKVRQELVDIHLIHRPGWEVVGIQVQGLHRSQGVFFIDWDLKEVLAFLIPCSFHFTSSKFKKNTVFMCLQLIILRFTPDVFFETHV